MIDWEGEKIIDKEPSRRSRQIKNFLLSNLGQKDKDTNEQRRGQLRAIHVYVTSFIISTEEVNMKRSDENLYR